MIQFNLLPDVKKDYVKAKRTKRLIITVSFLTSVTVIGILILLFSYVQLGQKKHINDLTEDINKELSALKSIPDLDKILTIQNQLNSISSLHEKRPASSRIFDYLYRITPEKVKIQTVEVNFVDGTMKVSGSADTLKAINQYADTLKFAKYKTQDSAPEDEGLNAFSNVITTSLNRDDDQARYGIVFKYDPVLFDNTKKVTIIVPKQITTRSITGKPALSDNGNSLFEDAQEVEAETE